MKSLIILYSYHHHNTEKVAKTIASILGADIKLPEDVNPEELQEYDLIGFGSGIYGGVHHKSLLELADSLPEISGKKVFLFSTSGGTDNTMPIKCHSALREKLQSKGYTIIDEFNCKGFFGFVGIGISRGRPNSIDLKNAEDFAQNLLKI
ncbi:MAG TPA: flavodoxin family protein [Methanobacterium sp.]|nr:flavodoxin family protein [Methanobacterium sp.]